MKNETDLPFSKGVYKKLLEAFGVFFLFIFLLLTINQLLLLSGLFKEYQPAFFQGFLLFLYSLPPVVVMCVPYAVCTGFTYGLIKNDFPKDFLKNNGTIMSVLVMGLIISILTFVFYDLIVSNLNKNFSELYKGISYKEKFLNESHLEMTSLELIKKINGMDERVNFYELELNKRYSISFGALFFTCFSVSLSIILNKRIKTAVCISVISCIIYWAFLTYGQNFSVKNGKYGALVMWLPNVFFLFISVILYVMRYKINRPRS